jgi:hypothetical protein
MRPTDSRKVQKEGKIVEYHVDVKVAFVVEEPEGDGK